MSSSALLSFLQGTVSATVSALQEHVTVLLTAVCVLPDTLDLTVHRVSVLFFELLYVYFTFVFNTLNDSGRD